MPADDKKNQGLQTSYAPIAFKCVLHKEYFQVFMSFLYRAMSKDSPFNVSVLDFRPTLFDTKQH